MLADLSARGRDEIDDSAAWGTPLRPERLPGPRGRPSIEPTGGLAQPVRLEGLVRRARQQGRRRLRIDARQELPRDPIRIAGGQTVRVAESVEQRGVTLQSEKSGRHLRHLRQEARGIGIGGQFGATSLQDQDPIGGDLLDLHASTHETIEGLFDQEHQGVAVDEHAVDQADDPGPRSTVRDGVRAGRAHIARSHRFPHGRQRERGLATLVAQAPTLLVDAAALGELGQEPGACQRLVGVPPSLGAVTPLGQEPPAEHERGPE